MSYPILLFSWKNIVCVWIMFLLMKSLWNSYTYITLKCRFSKALCTCLLITQYFQELVSGKQQPSTTIILNEYSFLFFSSKMIQRPQNKVKKEVWNTCGCRSHLAFLPLANKPSSCYKKKLYSGKYIFIEITSLHFSAIITRVLNKVKRCFCKLG